MARGRFSVIPPPKYPNLSAKQAKAVQKHDRVRILQGKICNLNTEGLNEFYELLSERLRDAGLIKEPVSKEARVKLFEKLEKCPWMNVECLNLLEEKAERLKEWQSNQCAKNFQALESCRSALKEGLTKLRTFWAERMKSINHFVDMEDLPLNGSRVPLNPRNDKPSDSKNLKCRICTKMFLTPKALRQHVQFTHRMIDPSTVKQMPHMKPGTIPAPLTDIHMRPGRPENRQAPFGGFKPPMNDPYMKRCPSPVPFRFPPMLSNQSRDYFREAEHRPFVLPDPVPVDNFSVQPQPYMRRDSSPSGRYDASPRSYARRNRSPDDHYRMPPVPIPPRDRSPDRYQRSRKRSRSPLNAYSSVIDEKAFYGRHDPQRSYLDTRQMPDDDTYYSRERRSPPPVPFNTPNGDWDSFNPTHSRRPMMENSMPCRPDGAPISSRYPDWAEDREQFPGPCAFEPSRFDMRYPMDMERESFSRRSVNAHLPSRGGEYSRRPYF